MNKMMIIGNVTFPPKMRTTNGGKSVASFSVAVKRRFKNPNGEYDTDFFDVSVFGALADLCEKYLEKGRRVAVTGAMQSRDYEKDGAKKRVWELVADEVEFLSPKGEGAPAKQEAPKKASFEPVDDEPMPWDM